MACPWCNTFTTSKVRFILFQSPRVLPLTTSPTEYPNDGKLSRFIVSRTVDLPLQTQVWRQVSLVLVLDTLHFVMITHSGKWYCPVVWSARSLSSISLLCFELLVSHLEYVDCRRWPHHDQRWVRFDSCCMERNCWISAHGTVLSGGLMPLIICIGSHSFDRSMVRSNFTIDGSANVCPVFMRTGSIFVST